MSRRTLPVVDRAPHMSRLHQVPYVFALHTPRASTIGLVLGAIPIFAALFGLVLGTERPSNRFWVAAAVSFLGVGLVAVGSRSELSTSLRGIVLGLCTAATWAAYSVVVAPLMHTYSPSRMSAV